ncbi:IKI3 family-domain-containing protein [Podospora appendiculata]|uniref:Elongator complex protein 1 n=1 Tax=Podospora appendiculata TaxID=314037 RepID=A0AAE1C926_9PEZI|nr:IKI3 family-domain-containing protein [Podospora appendiculata]
MAGGDIVKVEQTAPHGHHDEHEYGHDDDGDDRVSGEAHVEILGTIEPSIVAARWSPNFQHLIITTGDDNVVFMSRSSDGSLHPIATTAMTAEDLNLSKHVSVGWGKKETQFQGKGAKAKTLRDPTIPEKVDAGTLSSHDDGRCTISWRGDGAYVAVNFFQPGLRRVIRVYNCEGVLESVSEPVDGLEAGMGWRPEGNLIAGIQRLADRIDVVFFERNGLRHGQFTLQLPSDAPDAADDLALEWNPDSSVLAVVMKDRVQLWTTGNYHWYLKQEILSGPYDSQSQSQEQNRLPLFTWDDEQPLLFAVSTAGRVLVNEYIHTISRGPTSPPYDQGAVAVIDGRTIKFTPFGTAMVPPPMAWSEFEVMSPAIDIAFANDGSAMAVLHQLGVSLYALELNGARSCCPRLLETALFDEDDSCTHTAASFQISFVTRSRTVQVLQMDAVPKLITYDFEASAQGDKAWRETLDVDVDLVAAIASPDSSCELDGPLTQDHRGRITIGAHESLARFPRYLPQTGFVTYDGELLAFGLSKAGHLYANSRLLAKQVTSFVVTNSHLIFTNAKHLCKFVHLAGAEDLVVPQDDIDEDERLRKIETGGKIVTAMPTKMSLILQMPRGNLETIYPRAMVLAGIRRLIEQMEYGAAFLNCRAQRVDMNILYDHRPEQFLVNVDLVLAQVKDPAHIDLFLSTLKNEDVTQTMYKDTTLPTTDNQLPEPTVVAKPGKINTICDAILQRLRAKKEVNNQNIITAHVCKSPPALDDALSVVAQLMQEDESLAERAVEHVCFLVDVNKLFDRALGMYDLDLTLLVAQQSQRDPREYLPFIQELHKMSVLDRQFAIDDKLSNWEKALDHLKVLDDFQVVQDYVVKHSLYQHALHIYRRQEQEHSILTGLYAAHLKSRSQFREAGLAYESLNNFAEATDCYLKAGVACWRECLFTAQQQSPPMQADKLDELASTLADALREAKDYAAAATIHMDHLHSVETAIQCLCKGYLFADALRLVSLHKRPDLLESGVDAGLAEAFSSSTEFLADCKAQLKAQVPRIAELRQKAREDPLAFYEGDTRYAGMDIPDDVSVAASSRMSTNASLFTRYTGKEGSVGTLGSNVSHATSKNRKREEKKRARGRKGTVYEEEYLVNSVRRLVERVESTQGEVERLVFGLVRRNMAERARAIDDLMEQVVEGCKVAVGEVWGKRDEGEGVAAGGLVEDERDVYKAGGGEGVFQESLEAARQKQEPPVVGTFKRLSLLGDKR